MKRIASLVVIGVVATALIGASCGKPPKPEPQPTVDTTPPPVDTTPKETIPEPPPPPPPPKLKESQFETAYFDFDKYNLRPDARAALDHDYELLKQFPTAIIKIEGHCDERGTIEYNLSLGEKRAKAAMDYLVGLGIAPNRISIISYGKERPVDPGHNEEAWAKNRRAEFRVISQ
ncbi:MAG: peptidoglycan-associated lipoprotein Pal [Candidatus Zixiibacteriota bacterium]